MLAELAPLYVRVGLAISAVVKNAGARRVGTVLPPFMTILLSLKPGSLLERSRDNCKSPEGEEGRPPPVTSMFFGSVILRSVSLNVIPSPTQSP